MDLKPAHRVKADSALQEALRAASATQMLCVILLLDTGPEAPEPDLPITAFPTRRAWQQAVAREALRRVRAAVAGTLEDLRALGLEPEGWELGQAVVRGSPAAIAAAVELPGVKHAVLDWELGLLESLPEEPAESGE